MVERIFPYDSPELAGGDALHHLYSPVDRDLGRRIEHRDGLRIHRGPQDGQELRARRWLYRTWRVHPPGLAEAGSCAGARPRCFC
jgi:hypothetical protein